MRENIEGVIRVEKDDIGEEVITEGIYEEKFKKIFFSIGSNRSYSSNGRSICVSLDLPC